MAAELENGVADATRVSPTIGRISRSTQPRGTSVSVLSRMAWPEIAVMARLTVATKPRLVSLRRMRTLGRAAAPARSAATAGSVLASSASRMRWLASVCSNRVENSRSRWVRPSCTGITMSTGAVNGAGVIPAGSSRAITSASHGIAGGGGMRHCT